MRIRPHAPNGPTRILKLTPTLALTSLLAGCLVGPDYQRPNLLMSAKWAANNSTHAAQPAKLEHC